MVKTGRTAVFYAESKRVWLRIVCVVYQYSSGMVYKNGLAFPTKGASSNQDEDKNNLKDEHYEDFAEFLATVTKHFVDQGYNIPLISPINEPQVDWRKTPGADAEQEGCSYTHEKTKILVTALNDKLEEKGLATNILLGEASRWEPIYTTNSGGYYSNLVDHYFNPDYKNYYNGNEEGKYYLGNLKHVPNILCAHSYHTDKTWSSLKTAREKAYEKAQQFGVELYQTEWSMLSTDYDNYENYDDASYMDLALSMARVCIMIWLLPMSVPGHIGQVLARNVGAKKAAFI